MSRRIAVAQMTCTSSIEENLRQATDLIAQARLSNACFVCLPDSFDFIVEDPTHAVSLASTIHSNPLLSRYHALAVQSNLWMSLGGMHILSSQDPSRINKVHFILSPNDPTTPAATYNQTHIHQNHNNYTIPGNSLSVAYDTPIGNVGLTVGSDLYYPSIFSSLNESNANIILTPSVFSIHDVGDQGNYWQTLLKARAMDNQCYIAAASQVGFHSYNKESWGQSMIVNPMGDKVADAGRMGPGIIYADLNMDLIHQVRERIPLGKFRRDDILGKIPRATGRTGQMF